MYLLSALINHFILIIIVARFTSSTLSPHYGFVNKGRVKGWKNSMKNQQQPKLSKKKHSSKAERWLWTCCTKTKPNCEEHLGNYYLFFLKISICVDKMLFVLKMLKTRQFFQKRMKVCAENCPIFCKKYFSECDILCFRTCTVTTNFTVKIPVFFSGPIFFIFRQPWLLFRIWANLSSRLTSNTLFVWRHASCDSLWPDHSGFESPLGFCATSSSSSWAAVQRHASKFGPEVSAVIAATPTACDAKMQKANSVFLFLSFFLL